MDVFSAKGPSVRDTPLTDLKKLSANQENMHIRLKEMPKKSQRTQHFFNKPVEGFSKKNQTQQPQKGSFSKNRGQNPNFTRAKRVTFRRRLHSNNRRFGEPRLTIQQPQWQHQNQKSFTPRQQSQKYCLLSLKLVSFHQQTKIFLPQNLSFQQQIRTFSLRALTVNCDLRLMFLRLFLFTCLIDSSEHQRVMNVVILTT